MGEQKFKIIYDRGDREKLLEIAEIMVEYVRRNNIPIVVAGGHSAEHALYLFKTVWVRKFGKNSKPAFFSLSAASGRDITYKDNSDIEGLIKSKVKNLASKLDGQRSVFLLEEFSETGITIERLKRALQNIGAREVKVGCFGVGYEAKRKKGLIDVMGKFISCGPLWGKIGKKFTIKNQWRASQLRKELRVIAGARPIRRRA